MRSSGRSDPDPDPVAGTARPVPASFRVDRQARRVTRGQWLLWALGLVALALAVHILLGNDVEITGAVDAIEHLNWAWLLLGIGLELLSYVSYAAAERQLLLAGGCRLGVVPLTGTALASQAVANCLPAGTMFGAIAGYRLVHRRGAPELLTAWMLVVSTFLYVAVLALLAVIGAQVAGPVPYIPDLRVFAGGLLAVLAALAVVAVWLQRKGQLERAARTTAGAVQRLSGWHRDEPRFDADAFFERLGWISVDNTRWVSTVLLLAAAWITDMLCLLTAFYAVDAHPPVRGLLLAYCAAQLVAVLPATPGGLGVVEGSLTLALVAFGGAELETLAAVLLYRLVSFWGVIGAGILSYAGLRVTDPKPGSDGPGPQGFEPAPVPEESR